jgi:ribosomal protein S18 acetylase RimI-like enzyme
MRPAEERDDQGIGVLLQTSASESPSSEWEWDELLQDQIKLGRGWRGFGYEDSTICIVADSAHGLVGVCQLRYGEFVRCQHASHVLLVIHPSVREQNVGRRLLRGFVEHISIGTGVVKINMSVSEQDTALMKLLHSESWRVERYIEGALFINGEDVAVREYAFDL